MRESPPVIAEVFRKLAVGLPAAGGIEVNWFDGNVVALTGLEVAVAVPNDCGPRLAGCKENVTSCRL